MKLLILTVAVTAGSIGADGVKPLATWNANGLPGGCQPTILFENGSNWRGSCCGPGSCEVGSGSYRAQAGQFIFTVAQSEKDYAAEGRKEKSNFFRSFFKNGKCKHSVDVSAFDYSEHMTCGKNEFRKQESQVASGTEIVIKGIGPAVVLGMKQSLTTDNAKFRAKPSLTGKLNNCKVEYGMDQFGAQGVIPANVSITLVARTAEKAKVQNWENYWYYVEVPVGFGNKNCKQNKGWIFGEFVKEP